MTIQEEIPSTLKDLKDVIASQNLSEQLQQRAKGLLQRIERPFRLGVFGLPGSGKSAIMNLLLGKEVLPEHFRLPTIQLVHGDKAEAVCTLGDRTQLTVEGEDMREVSMLSPAFVEARLPLPALTKLSMMEVVAGDSQEEQQRAIQWASKKIDIALWCTSGQFGEAEQDLWDLVPEKLDDHSFLVVTKTDAHSSQAELRQRLSEAEANGQDFFRKVLPVGTKTAIAARNSDGTVDKETMKSSGAVALISSILRDVEAGRQHGIDQADVFLRQIDFTPSAEVAGNTKKATLGSKQTQTAAPQNEVLAAVERALEEEPSSDTSGKDEQEPETDAHAEEKQQNDAQQVNTTDALVESAEAEEPKTGTEVASEATSETGAEPNDQPERDIEENTEPESLKETDANKVPEVVQVESLQPASWDLIKQVVDQLGAEGGVLLEKQIAGELDDGAIIETCVDTVSWVAEYLTSNGDQSDHHYQKCCDIAMDAADVIQLIQLEPGDSVASDALTLMVQVKQEMQTSLAA